MLLYLRVKNSVYHLKLKIFVGVAAVEVVRLAVELEVTVLLRGDEPWRRVTDWDMLDGEEVGNEEPLAEAKVLASSDIEPLRVPLIMVLVDVYE